MVSEAQIFDVMKGYVGTIVARSIIQTAATNASVELTEISDEDLERMLPGLENGIRAFNSDAAQINECMSQLSGLASKTITPVDDVGFAGTSRMHVDINEEYDVVIARGHARNISQRAGFTMSEQVKVTTVASELARNIVQYVGTGCMEMISLETPKPGIEIRAIDKGHGIPNLDAILAGDYVSRTGMGMGLVGARRLMDEFSVRTDPSGTEIVARKYVT